jgi:hypothetical protein
MMQQQFLLIILAVIIVGAAVAVGFSMASDQAASLNRDHLSTDLQQLATRVQHYYRRPQAFGGGDKTFDGLTIDKVTSHRTTDDGTFQLVSGNSGQGPVRLRGTGNTIGNDRTNFVKVDMLITPDSVYTDMSSLN